MLLVAVDVNEAVTRGVGRLARVRARVSVSVRVRGRGRVRVRVRVRVISAAWVAFISAVFGARSLPIPRPAVPLPLPTTTRTWSG